MIPKRYTSFHEIDKDLKVLRLRQEIDREHLRLNAHRFKKGLYPTQLLGGVGGLVQKLMVSLVARRLFKKFT